MKNMLDIENKIKYEIIEQFLLDNNFEFPDTLLKNDNIIQLYSLWLDVSSIFNRFTNYYLYLGSKNEKNLYFALLQSECFHKNMKINSDIIIPKEILILSDYKMSIKNKTLLIKNKKCVLAHYCNRNLFEEVLKN